MTNRWSNTLFVVPKQGDYWDAFGATYPEVAKWVQAVANEAGTSDANAKLLQAAGAMLADFADWASRAESAMRQRRPMHFDRLCADLEAMRSRWGVPSAGLTEIKEIDSEKGGA